MRSGKVLDMVNKAEAHFGLGEWTSIKKHSLCQQLQHEEWMMTAFVQQREKLRLLLRQHGHLMNPAWREE
jgi:hypothetical protein